ncbi:hypothetical protein ACHAXA_003968 [Cyclostephanos tholiformis]|uniref:Uncharacterized protein n=1 Tax=Cyclostephanos tholiformis TaxID=382380 RepID=A0ABD3R401_9STRA
MRIAMTASSSSSSYIGRTSILLLLSISTKITQYAMADRENVNQGNYFQRLRKRGGRKKGADATDAIWGGNDKRSSIMASDASSSRTRTRPRKRTGTIRRESSSSVIILARFIVLCASISCAVRFLLHRTKEWVGMCCRYTSEFRRSVVSRSTEASLLGRDGRKGKTKTSSRKDDGGKRGNDNDDDDECVQSISPSIMAIIDLRGNYSDDAYDDDDEASIISATFSRMRRRAANYSDPAHNRTKNERSSLPNFHNASSGKSLTRPRRDVGVHNNERSYDDLSKLINFIEEDDRQRHHRAVSATASATTAKTRRTGPILRGATAESSSSDEASSWR